MADDWVLKLKKPVKRAFLDFSTVDARHFFCSEEVRLNRRLARETYRGVKPLYADLSGNLTLEERGTAVDWVVEMRRLPEADMLDRRIKARDLVPTQLFEALGAAWIGPIFFAALERRLANRPCDRLIAVYGGFRALLRARLCLAHLLETPLREPEKWRPLALAYLKLARARLSLIVS
ncbi:hypothetical protein D9M72_562490 [compost metagenome]